MPSNWGRKLFGLLSCSCSGGRGGALFSLPFFSLLVNLEHLPLVLGQWHVLRSVSKQTTEDHVAWLAV